jgi:predicted enzyme related to lactoylglutathione lyase
MRISGPVLDTSDAAGLAKFYERLLGWTMTECEGPRPGNPPGDGWARVRSPSGDLKMEFQWEEHYTPPVWPPVPGKQQMMIHLDIIVEDLDAGVAWALEVGATVAEQQPQKPGDHLIMLDPAGHPFCMCRGDV